ncbi:hypothetical protein, partial [Staphylococcus epidermidis]|uniref:hypothetical protein n=1 Tax=Staphylococcus epidermidis TaxID=1282 RepID=UPI00273854ED
MRPISAIVLAILIASPAAAGAGNDPEAIFNGTDRRDGLLSTHISKADGRILFTFPTAGADSVLGRFLFTPSLRTGLGAAPTYLDRGRIGATQVIAFRRIGKKVAIQLENPRFRATGTGPLDAAGSA